MCRCLTKRQIWLILHISGAWFDDDTRTVSRKRSKITKYFIQIWRWIFLYMRLCFCKHFFFSKVVSLRVFHLKQQFNEINLFQKPNKFTLVIIALLEIRARDGFRGRAFCATLFSRTERKSSRWTWWSSQPHGGGIEGSVTASS